MDRRAFFRLLPAAPIVAAGGAAAASPVAPTPREVKPLELKFIQRGEPFSSARLNGLLRDLQESVNDLNERISREGV